MGLNPEGGRQDPLREIGEKGRVVAFINEVRKLAKIH